MAFKVNDVVDATRKVIESYKKEYPQAKHGNLIICIPALYHYKDDEELQGLKYRLTFLLYPDKDNKFYTKYENGILEMKFKYNLILLDDFNDQIDNKNSKSFFQKYFSKEGSKTSQGKFKVYWKYIELKEKE